ncbi:uncharacterized protein Z518_11062 [Rhinocladiella mackenziei CBS 650.93]|uniref:Rhinocladiella mackenziei CBS 650.93 unplaced genomic scaffold supercont1.11, whole genome shotgun sequence n=1 Tax=Rhinocladiella mackenziei CBS 650.93 TaxID=1442369 RepID=A0A0D2ISB9_9EURO|nr:uncharacterized protein Z518_11062 [Rhinocladiella mackenziei CBS 650.93]KIW99649.1 hypothetical protein Z518_11062 [Rhinocladiella mackenziei CBS 650.93]
MQDTKPRRIVLRFHVNYELEEAAIIERFFAISGLNPADDFYSHLMAPNESPMMHIVLDMHCKTVPSVELDKMEYEVFKVKKKDELHVNPFSMKAWTKHLSVTFSSWMPLHAIMLANAAGM